MGAFLTRYLQHIFTASVAIASIVGLLVATWREMQWLAIFFALALFTGSISFACFCWRDKRTAETQRDKAISDLASTKQLADERVASECAKCQEAEQNLERVASEVVSRIQAALEQQNVRAFLDMLTDSVDFIARLIAIAETGHMALDVKSITCEGDSVYVIAKADDVVMENLRDGDTFVLAKEALAKLPHPVAVVRVSQVGRSLPRAVAFLVVGALDETIHTNIIGLARTTEVSGLKGLKIRPNIDLGAFDGIDMRSMCDAMGRLRRVIEPTLIGD